MVKLDETNYKEILKEGTQLVDFYADWCQPCHIMEPILETFQKDTNLPLHKVNVDEQQQLSHLHKIMSIPTLIIYQEGVEKGRIVGALPVEALKRKISDLTR